MTACYLVGIGGTGAKCVQAYLHLAAAGLGPATTGVMLVDQDAANGNLRDARHLLGVYRQLHSKLRGRAHHLGESPFLRTRIEFADEPVWSPLPRARISLKQHFQYDALRPEARLLFDAIFARKLERDQPLDEGFRGRPAVGAAAMFSAADAPERVWQKALDGIRASEREDLRIVVVGSIFGGTGASGLPTIARILRREAGADSRVDVAGVLMLPYFRYAIPSSEDSDASIPRAEAFMLNSQHALRYYQDIMNREGKTPFDSLFLIGSDPLFELEYTGAGGSTQRNPALLPELLSAVAACHYFQSPSLEPKKVYVAGRDPNGVDWSSIPGIARGSTTLNVRAHLGQLLRFALAYLSAYRSNLVPERHEAFRNQVWYRTLISNAAVDLNRDDAQSVLDALQAYCESLVSWCGSFGDRPLANEGTVDLFRMHGLIDRAADDGVKAAIDRFSRLTRQDKQLFKGMIPTKEEPGLDEVFLSVSRFRPRPDRRGIGVFVDALYERSQLTGAMPSSVSQRT